MISVNNTSVNPQHRRLRSPGLLQHRRREVSHQLPMVSKLTIYAPEARTAHLVADHRDSLISAETFCVFMKPLPT